MEPTETAQSVRRYDGDADTPQRESQVQSELGQLDDAIAKLGAIVEESEQRLRLVLRDEVAASTLRTSEDVMLVPQAERVRSMRERVVAITDKLSGINNRIEV